MQKQHMCKFYIETLHLVDPGTLYPRTASEYVLQGRGEREREREEKVKKKKKAGK